MKLIFPTYFLCLLLAISALPAATLPTWAAKNTAGQPVRIAVSAPEGDRFAHLSWPKAVRTPRGTVLLAYSAGQGHNTGSSGPSVSRSTDGGKTFTAPHLLMRFPEDDARYLDCGNIALGVAENGDVLLLAMAFRRDETNDIFGWRSTDDGVTWTRSDTSALGPNKTGSVFGVIVPVKGQGFVALGHYRAGAKPYTRGIWLSASADNGRTWGEARRIADVGAVEPMLVPVGGRLLGFFRGENALGGRQYVGASDDNGLTWKTELSVLDAEHPKAARLAAPCAVANPNNPGEVLVLTTERAVPGNTPGRIWLWRGDAHKLAWARERVLLEIPKLEGDLNTDFGYPWLLHVSGHRWQMYYYHGNSRASCHIWVTDVEL